MGKSIKVAIVALVAIASIYSMPSILQAQNSVTAPMDGSSVNSYELFFPKGWSFFAFQAEPLAKDPEALFWDKDGIKIPINQGNLYSFNPYLDNINEGVFTYDPQNPNEFGPIDQSLGYWIRVDEDTTLKYWGVETYRRTSTWLHKGWNMVAYPYEQDQSIDNLKIRSHATGDEMSLLEARNLRIVDSILLNWTNDWRQGLEDVGLEEDYVSSNLLKSGHGYWMRAFQEGYDLVIDKP